MITIKVFHVYICLKLNIKHNGCQSYSPVQCFYFKPCRLSMGISESNAVNLYPTEQATVLEFHESTVKCVYIPSLETKNLLDASCSSCYTMNYIFAFVFIHSGQIQMDMSSLGQVC